MSGDRALLVETLEGSDFREDGALFSVIALFCDLGIYSRCKYKVYLL